MGKKSDAKKGLGAALIRDRFKGNRRARDDETSVVRTHTHTHTHSAGGGGGGALMKGAC